MSFSPQAPLSLVVGYSGGLDSTVLLHLMHRMQQRLPQLFSLSAIHVHHGLQPAADAFKSHAVAFCHALGLPLQVMHVAITEADLGHLGLEAAARRYRYQAFAKCLPPAAVLLLAHHRDDLIETALLQWIRGAGLEGLSAMTRLSTADIEGRQITRWRPLLDHSRQALLDYAQSEGLRWVEDPSNADRSLARNRIRHEVMPVLRSIREGADSAMSRSISHLQTARDLLELVTDQDAQCRTFVYARRGPGRPDHPGLAQAPRRADPANTPADGVFAPAAGGPGALCADGPLGAGLGRDLACGAGAGPPKYCAIIAG
jgi:tRNA(Ile)-lysidine synthase